MNEPMTLAAFRTIVEERIQLADRDPETGHGSIDDLAVDVIASFLHDPEDLDAYAKALFYRDLLQREEDDGWVRWYA